MDEVDEANSPFKMNVNCLHTVSFFASISPALCLVKFSFTFPSMQVKSSWASPWNSGNWSRVSYIVSIFLSTFLFENKCRHNR